MTGRWHLIILVLLATYLQGCAVAVIGAAGVGASVANDRRTVGTQLDDQNAESQVAFQWSKSDELKAQANLQIDIYNGVALLTGQAPTQELVNQAVTDTQKIGYIKKIHNQLRVAEPIGAGTQANDIWLATKVRTKLAADDRVPVMQVVVVVQDSEVFLMGRLSNQEATAAVDIARNVSGVTRVIRAFEIM